MSFNITVDVDEEGNAKVAEDPSYTKPDNCRPGRYVISGHFVPEGEHGHEYVAVSTPTNLSVSGGYDK